MMHQMYSEMVERIFLNFILRNARKIKNKKYY